MAVSRTIPPAQYFTSDHEGWVTQIVDTDSSSEVRLVRQRNVTVTFDPNGGSFNDGTSTITTSCLTGETVTAPDAPVLTDSIFTGWYTGTTDNGKLVLSETPYQFTTPVAGNLTLYAGWKQLKYTMHYGDGREHDGEFGYNYAEGQNGYYVPSKPEQLPSEVRHFAADSVNSDSYPGVNKAGWYFLSWMRYAETAKEDINPDLDVYVKNGTDFVKITDWRNSTQTLYQYIMEGKTQNQDCGDIDYYAQWVLVQIDVNVDIKVDIDAGTGGKLVSIDESQKAALAKNIDISTDVRGNNTSIKLTAYVRDANSADELAAINAHLGENLPQSSNRLDYDVCIEKVINYDTSSTHMKELSELAEPIEIVFAIPTQWQHGGTVTLYRAHTNGSNITVEKLDDLDSNSKTITTRPTKFSTYTMIFTPDSSSSGGEVSQYTLHYESNGGTVYKDEQYTGNTVVMLDKVPARDGYTFTGWYADKALTEKISDIKMVSNKTVYAGWRQATVPEMLNGKDHFAYVVGYTDGEVKPLNNITRAEVASIFFRLLKDEVRDANLTADNTFTDVSEGQWCNTAVSTMAKLGIVKGRTATTFDPNAPITRAELAAICARFDTTVKDGNSSFSDIDNHWAKAEIERAATLGWIRGYKDGTFCPDKNITRAEAMTLINRVLVRIPETADDLLDGMNIWPDNQPKDWYYLAVQEATNSHDYQSKGEVYEKWTALIKNFDWSQYE